MVLVLTYSIRCFSMAAGSGQWGVMTNLPPPPGCIFQLSFLRCVVFQICSSVASFVLGVQHLTWGETSTTGDWGSGEKKWTGDLPHLTEYSLAGLGLFEDRLWWGFLSVQDVKWPSSLVWGTT